MKRWVGRGGGNCLLDITLIHYIKSIGWVAVGSNGFQRTSKGLKEFKIGKDMKKIKSFKENKQTPLNPISTPLCLHLSKVKYTSFIFHVKLSRPKCILSVLEYLYLSILYIIRFHCNILIT